MKRLFCRLLALLLACFALAGCDRRSPTPEDNDTQDAIFDPETTAVGGLTQAVEDQVTDTQGIASDEPTESDPAEAPLDDPDENPSDGSSENPGGDSGDPIVEDQLIGLDEYADVPTPTPDAASPFTTPTPQPNAFVSEYADVSAKGLGFRFSYPANWVNIPGRSTVCYVQPIEDGTIYPARVAVTMKRMPHATNANEAKTEFANFFRKLMTQYDSSTFKVNTNLDTSTKFMGKAALATTYLAYDGNQEIKGYAIVTYYDRYLFVFHFLCAYEDYAAFDSTLKYMRDSVKAEDNFS